MAFDEEWLWEQISCAHVAVLVGGSGFHRFDKFKPYPDPFDFSKPIFKFPLAS